METTTRPGSRSLRRLMLPTMILAISFLICVQAVSMGLVMPALGAEYGHVLSIVVYSAGVIIFTVGVYRVIDGMQAKIIRSNEELSAINAVSHAVAGSLEIEKTLGLALDNAVKVSGAIAGEIAIRSEAGGTVRRFGPGHPGYLPDPDEASSRDEEVDVDAAIRFGHGRVVSIPLNVSGDEIGVMRLVLDESNPLTGDQSDGLLSGIGAQIAMAVRAGQLHEDVLRRQRDSQALYEIAMEITSAQDPKDVLCAIADRAREMLHADAASVCLFEYDRPVSGCNGQRRAPLNIASDRVGELCVVNARGTGREEEDQYLLGGMADLAAIAVQKSRLLEKSRQVTVLEERERLAREMHDSLAQVLGLLHLKSKAALVALRRGAVPRVDDDLCEMASVAREGYKDVREAILGLHESVSPTRGFVDALREYLPKFSQQASVPAELDVRGSSDVRIGPEAEVQLMRVVQEALTNVRKHADATRASVRLRQSDSELSITIEDDGIGFDVEKLKDDGRRFGLWTMRERVERVGGRVEIESRLGQGTRIHVVVPVQGG